MQFHKKKHRHDNETVRRQVDGLPLSDFLELSSLAMTDPLSGTPLFLGGEDVDVTADNVNEYVDAVTSRWAFHRTRSRSQGVSYEK